MASAAGSAHAQQGVVGVLALQGAFIEHLAKFQELGVQAVEVRTPADLARCDALVLPGGESTAMGLIAERSGMVRAWACRLPLLSLSTPSFSFVHHLEYAVSCQMPTRTPFSPFPPQLAPLRTWVAERRPTWGTCAGLILLADRATGQKAGGQALLGGVDCTVHRNFFGAQSQSFEGPLLLAGVGGGPDAGGGDPALRAGLGLSAPGVGGASSDGCLRGIFIRAPALLELGAGVRSLAFVRVPPAAAEAAAAAAAAAGAPPPSPEVCVAARTGDARFLVTAFHPELAAGAPGWHAYFCALAQDAVGVPFLPATGAAGGALARLGHEVFVPLNFDASGASSGNPTLLNIARRVVPGQL